VIFTVNCENVRSSAVVPWFDSAALGTNGRINTDLEAFSRRYTKMVIKFITMKPSRILSGFVVAALILSGCKQEKAPSLSAAGPPQVVVAAVEQRDVPIVRESLRKPRG